MEPIDIKYEMEKAGIRQHDIAKRCGVVKSMVNMVIRRYKGTRSAKVEREIATAIGRPVAEVFPEYYEQRKAS